MPREAPAAGPWVHSTSTSTPSRDKANQKVLPVTPPPPPQPHDLRPHQPPASTSAPPRPLPRPSVRLPLPLLPPCLENVKSDQERASHVASSEVPAEPVMDVTAHPHVTSPSPPGAPWDQDASPLGALTGGGAAGTGAQAGPCWAAAGTGAGPGPLSHRGGHGPHPEGHRGPGRAQGLRKEPEEWQEVASGPDGLRGLSASTFPHGCWPGLSRPLCTFLRGWRFVKVISWWRLKGCWPASVVAAAAAACPKGHPHGLWQWPGSRGQLVQWWSASAVQEGLSLTPTEASGLLHQGHNHT